ncbi:hypothetical protein J8I87_33385 [Paraburkholderia sp. LEh10]|uniref:hypothetical protein n=1 Tax=Paraburkholderia sp. LEh10 TaxID=2821353 RepID=UPI001AE86863|nr:hypothetical protein [Paraburkholderia sp. LEh10]MBP0594475.1 hypothetical protein [Paraburkholderia sp. LEh10]
MSCVELRRAMNAKRSRITHKLKEIVMLACYDPRSFFLSDFEDQTMKKVVLALVAAVGFVGMSSAFANDHHHECHKVHVHHHWEKRCH